MMTYPKFAMLVLALVLAAGPARAAEPYAIDVILPMTGPAAFNGKLQEQGLRAYETLVNKAGGIHGRPVRFDIHDDQSDPVVDVQIVNSLIANRPVVILGPSSTAACSAVLPLLNSGPLNYCFSPGVNPQPGSYVFGSGATLQANVFSLYALLRDHGFKRVAVLIATDGTGLRDQDLTKAFFASPAHGAATLVADELFAPADQSVAAQVARVKAAAPDVIVNWATGSAFGTSLRDIATAGLDGTVMVSSPVNANPQELNQFAAYLPKTLLIQGLPFQGGPLTSAPLRQAAAEYLAAVKSAGVEPNAFHANGWDPTRIVVSALRALPDGATAAQLHDYLERLHGFGGLYGMYDLRGGDQHGVSGNDQPLIRWNAATQSWLAYDAQH